MTASAAAIRIAELRRLGAGVIEETPLVFEWDAATHSMPQDALEYELKINTVRELDPLSEEVVEQVMGPEWTPFEMHGEWLDKWAGQGFAELTEREFLRMAGRAPLVRVQVDRRSFVGIITNVKIRYRTRAEIGYTITFSPHTNENVGSFRRPPGVAPIAYPIEARIAEQDAILADLSDAHTTAMDNVPAANDDIVEVEDEIDAVDDELERATAANDAIAFDALGDDDDAQALADRTQSGLLALASSFDRVATVATNLGNTVAVLSADEVVAYDDVVGAMFFEEWVRGTHVNSILMASSARSAAADARSRAALRPLTVYVTKKNDSLQRISNRFYGTPSAWRLIYDANDLDSILMSSGVTLIIPERQR